MKGFLAPGSRTVEDRVRSGWSSNLWGTWSWAWAGRRVALPSPAAGWLLFSRVRLPSVQHVGFSLVPYVVKVLVGFPREERNSQNTVSVLLRMYEVENMRKRYNLAVQLAVNRCRLLRRCPLVRRRETRRNRTLDYDVESTTSHRFGRGLCAEQSSNEAHDASRPHYSQCPPVDFQLARAL